MTIPDGSEFEWVREAWGRALRCRPLADAARHLFSSGQLRLRGGGDEERRGWSALAASLGVPADRVVRLTQVHGRDVLVLRRQRDLVLPHHPQADIVISDEPTLALAVQVADCIPLLLGDPRTGAVAAAHAGWRGMAVGVPRVAVAALGQHFGSRPEHLVAAAGPSIGPCCYEVRGDVLDAFRSEGWSVGEIERWFLPGPGPARPPDAGRQTARFRCDLWTAAEDQLAAAGLDPRHIHVSRLCTACDEERFWSYRRDGAGTGRLAGVIRAAGPPRPLPGSPAGRPPRSARGARARR